MAKDHDEQRLRVLVGDVCLLLNCLDEVFKEDLWLYGEKSRSHHWEKGLVQDNPLTVLISMGVLSLPVDETVQGLGRQPDLVPWPLSLRMVSVYLDGYLDLRGCNKWENRKKSLSMEPSFRGEQAFGSSVP